MLVLVADMKVTPGARRYKGGEGAWGWDGTKEEWWGLKRRKHAFTTENVHEGETRRSGRWGRGAEGSRNEAEGTMLTRILS